MTPNENFAFAKTPAGIYPRFVIPSKKIAKRTEGRFLNTLTLNLNYTPQENWKYAMAPPPYLLLMPEDSLRTFFENRNIENGITTFISTDGRPPLYTGEGYNISTRTYSFPNIINLINTHIKNKPDEDLRILAIPVNRIYSVNNREKLHYTTAIKNYLMPSGLKLNIGGDKMNLVILSNKYENK